MFIPIPSPPKRARRGRKLHIAPRHREADLRHRTDLQRDVERINASIVECKRVLSLANHQISDLREFEMADRVGFFDTVTAL